MFSIEPQELVTKAEKIDTLYWQLVREGQPNVAQAFPERADAVVGADLFNGLYQFKPELRQNPPEPVRARAMKQIMDGSDWMRLHEATMGDEMLSAAGALTLRERLEQEPDTRDMMDHLERLEAIQETLQAIQASPELQEGVDQMADVLRAEAKGLGQEVDKALADKGVLKALRGAMHESAERLENAQQVAAGWGNEAGTLQQVLFDPRLSQMMQADKIRRILDLAGRMRDTVSAQRSKRPKAGPQRVEIALGSDLSKVIPTEIAMLGDPELEPLFLRKYAESALMLYERVEKPRLGRGPFVVCEDESGSMKGAKEEWAKAIAFALCTQAHKEHRAFGAIGFSDAGSLRQVFKPEAASLLEWMAGFFGSGTDFDAPLRAAVKMIDGDLPEADIVFITDGECQVSASYLAQFKEAKKKLGIKAIGINIGPYTLEPLKAFCDVVFRLSAQRGATDLEAVIEEIK